MNYVIAVLCLSALTGQLVAEESNSCVPGTNAQQRNYPAVEAFLRKLCPRADIQIDANGSIVLHSPSPNSTFDPTLIEEGLEPFSPPPFLPFKILCPETTFGEEPCSTGVYEWSFSDGNPVYAQYLPIRHFILTELQMAQFFANPPLRPVPLDFFGFSESKLYLVVQIKNLGSRFASGTLYFPFFHKSFSISVDLEANTEEFSTYIVPLGIMRREDLHGEQDVRDCLDKLLWDHLSVSLTEEAIITILEKRLSLSDPEEDETDDDPEEEQSRFPIFRSVE